MGILRLINRIYVINRIFGFHRKKGKLNKRERFHIAIDTVHKRIKDIKYSKNIDTVNKHFDSMMIELHDCIKNKPFFEDIDIGGYKINKIKDLPIIEQIRKEYIKAFLLERIELELKKSDSVNSPFVKDRYIKKALFTAIQSVEYLPDDTDLRYKIVELEEILKNSYNNRKGV